MTHGVESPDAKREDGDITVTRTIRIPSGSIVITGTLTEADQIYRLLPKYLSQNGYKLATPRQIKMGTVDPGEPSSSEITFLRNRIAQLEELLGAHPDHQRIKELTRLLIEAREDKNQWMQSFIELDEGMADVLATLEGGDAPRTIRETIAIQKLDQL